MTDDDETRLFEAIHDFIEESDQYKVSQTLEDEPLEKEKAVEVVEAIRKYATEVNTTDDLAYAFLFEQLKAVEDEARIFPAP